MSVTVSCFKTSTSTPFYLSNYSLSVHTSVPFFYSLKLFRMVFLSVGSGSDRIFSSKYTGGGHYLLYCCFLSMKDLGATDSVWDNMYGLLVSSASSTSSTAYRFCP